MKRVLLGLALLALAGCEDGSGERQIRRLNAEHARLDPPALWSIAVMNEADNGHPVLICANRRIVSGFSSIVPFSGGKPCLRERDMTETADGFHYRCKLGEVTYGVASTRSGDWERDFQVSSLAHPISFGGTEYARTLHFQRLGACPAGWRLGEATDQNGARTMAFIDDAGGA